MSGHVAAPPRTVVGILLFDGCDLLDVGGPYEVLLTANRLALRQQAEPPFEITTLSATGSEVAVLGGLGLRPQRPATTTGALDVLVVPGAVDIDGVLADPPLLEVVGALADGSRVVTSVCTGAFLLAAVGRLRGRPATTHHEDLPALAARTDVGEAVPGVRWVDDGTLVTAAGLASGLAFGLHLVDRFAGRALATATAAQLEHPWDPDEGWSGGRTDPAVAAGAPTTAPGHPR